MESTNAFQHAGSWAAVAEMSGIYKEAAIYTAQKLQLDRAHCSEESWQLLCQNFVTESRLEEALSSKMESSPNAVKTYCVWSPEHSSTHLRVNSAETYEQLVEAENATGYNCSSEVRSVDIEATIAAFENESNCSFCFQELSV
jgi:hypothetical protein